MKDRIKEYFSYLRRRMGWKSLVGSGALYSLDLPLRTSGYALSAGLYFSNLTSWNVEQLLMIYSALRISISIPETLIVRRQVKEGEEIITPDIFSSSLGVSIKRPDAGPLIKGIIDVMKQIPLYYGIPEPLLSIHMTTELGLTVFRAGKDGLISIREYASRRKNNPTDSTQQR